MNMYGLSETTGSATFQKAIDLSFNSCGYTLAGSDIKIANPDDEQKGEIRIYGRHIMMGYKDNEEATMGAIDENGYFCTGDQGRIE